MFLALVKSMAIVLAFHVVLLESLCVLCDMLMGEVKAAFLDLNTILLYLVNFKVHLEISSTWRENCTVKASYADHIYIFIKYVLMPMVTSHIT